MAILHAWARVEVVVEINLIEAGSRSNKYSLCERERERERMPVAGLKWP